MKLMEPGEQIALACPSEATLTLAQERLKPLVQNDGDDNKWLVDGLKTGRYKTREVQVEGLPFYVFYVSNTDSNFLNVNACAFVGDKQRPEIMVAGAERIARELGCVGVVFTTSRRGLAEIALSNGYATRGVTLAKKL